MITKRELVLKLAQKKSLQVIAKNLGISQNQVLRYLLTEDTWKPKPRKPKVVR